jgi:hypothetical protein
LVRVRARAEVLPQVWRRQHIGDKFSGVSDGATMMRHPSLRVARAPSLDVEFRMERKSEPRRVLPTSRVFGFALSDAFAFDE